MTDSLAAVPVLETSLASPPGDHAPRTHYRNSTREKAEAIRAEYFHACECCGRRPRQWDLARKHGLSQSTVSQIIAGKVWA